MSRKIKISVFRQATRLCLISAAALSLSSASSFAQTQSFLNVQANGLAPGQTITLATGPKQSLSAKADIQGQAVFRNLKYSPEGNLAFSLAFQVKGQAQQKPVANNLVLNLDPFTGAVNVKGKATRAASIVMNLSSEDSKALIANQTGYFEGTAYSTTGLDTGRIDLLASIVNVEEICCPRSFKPYLPVTIKIQAVPQKKAALDVVRGELTASSMINLRYASAVSVPSELVERSWLTGIRRIGNRMTEALLSQTSSWGSFLNAQNLLDARRAQQEQAARTAKSFASSEALCRFGSLSQSLGASDSLKDTNGLMLMSMLNNRENGSSNTIYADRGGNAVESRINQLRSNYCNPNESNAALNDLCERNKNNDSQFNKDINYTSSLDVPMTLDVDFTAGGQAGERKDQEAVLALAENLFPPHRLYGDYSSANYVKDSGLYRSLQSMRNVAKSSLVSYVAEKSKGTTGSEDFITALMQSLGVPEAQARTLMGENPSYFAQMEVLTKKLYQDPAFYVNLVDTPANVQRQRAAIRAIKLQQGHDLAETVKRREMLLAILLELKIRERAAIVSNQLITARGG